MKVLPPVPPVDVELRLNQEISVLGQVTAVSNSVMFGQAVTLVQRTACCDSCHVVREESMVWTHVLQASQIFLTSYLISEM